jgi:predicted permease
VFFSLGTVLSLLFLAVGKWAFGKDSTKNILAFAAGTGNTGYFGIPAATALFGDAALSPVVLCILGVILYEHSVGFVSL